MRLALLAAVLGLVLALAACGRNESSPAAEAKLDRAFARDVSSGKLSVRLVIRLEDGPLAEQPLQIELSGPFSNYANDMLPELDLTVRAVMPGETTSARLVLLPDNAYVVYEGGAYEVGTTMFRQLLESAYPENARRSLESYGIDPLGWVSDLGEDGDEVTGRIDLSKMIEDLNRLAPSDADQVPDPGDTVEDPRFRLAVDDEGLWRSLSAEAQVEIPDDAGEQFGGASEAGVLLQVTLSEPNTPQEIRPPAGARPIQGLLERLGLTPGTLL